MQVVLGCVFISVSCVAYYFFVACHYSVPVSVSVSVSVSVPVPVPVSVSDFFYVMSAISDIAGNYSAC